jgi:hypothetical protein
MDIQIKQIVVKDLVKSTFTNDDALPLMFKMSEFLDKGYSITLSFDGISGITSSFLNSSLGEVIDKYGLDSLKGRIFTKNCTSSLNNMLKNYINSYKACDFV